MTDIHQDRTETGSIDRNIWKRQTIFTSATIYLLLIVKKIVFLFWFFNRYCNKNNVILSIGISGSDRSSKSAQRQHQHLRYSNLGKSREQHNTNTNTKLSIDHLVTATTTNIAGTNLKSCRKRRHRQRPSWCQDRSISSPATARGWHSYSTRTGPTSIGTSSGLDSNSGQCDGEVVIQLQSYKNMPFENVVTSTVNIKVNCSLFAIRYYPRLILH